jgi:hypothetical protein
MRWAQYLCSLKYGLNLSLMTEFAVSQDACQESDEAGINCAKILDDNNIVSDDWWIYVCVLLALFLGMRTIAMSVLAKKAVKFY